MQCNRLSNIEEFLSLGFSISPIISFGLNVNGNFDHPYTCWSKIELSAFLDTTQILEAEFRRETQLLTNLLLFSIRTAHIFNFEIRRRHHREYHSDYISSNRILIKLANFSFWQDLDKSWWWKSSQRQASTFKSNSIFCKVNREATRQNYSPANITR